MALTDRRITDEDLHAVQDYCVSVETINLSLWRKILGVFRSFFLRLPFQTGYFYHPGVRKVLQRVMNHKQPDVVFCQLVRVAGYLKELDVPKVLDYQDALSMNMKRRSAKAPFLTGWLFGWEAKLLRRYEAYILEKFDRCMIISEPDQRAIQHPKSDTILVVPNGVDSEFFTADQSVKTEYEVVFTGNMGYAPNVLGAGWLAGEIMPQVRKTLPGARLLLAGASPSASVRRLASEYVKVTGWMDDIRDAYRSSIVFVAPMLTGSGLQNKLLEAMSMNMPCVTTSLANAALDGVHGEEILVADTTAQMTESIVKLLTDQDFANRISRGGHKMVLQRYSWEKIIGNMEKTLGWR